MAVSPEPRTTRTLMGRLRDLPVGRKLLLGFGSVALVVLLLVAVVLGAMDQLGVANGEIVDTALPKVEVDPQTYEVFADGELLTCEPAEVLPMAQRYFLL